MSLEARSTDHQGAKVRAGWAELDAISGTPDSQLCVSAALERRGINIGSLSETELDDLEALLAARVRQALDDVVRHWQEERGLVGEQERLARELRRRIVAGKEPPYGFECEGCSFRHDDHHPFVELRGLFLCDGCSWRAREVLRDLQRPLIEALEAEPTLESARALGFELVRGRDGRLVWVGDDETFDGGAKAYADEREALQCLVEELG